MIESSEDTTEIERTNSRVTSAFSLISGYTADKKTFIVELTEDCFYVIGQALHLYKASEENNKLIDIALQSLAEQTTCVSLDSKQHKVYKNIVNSPPLSKTTREVAYIPYDREKKK